MKMMSKLPDVMAKFEAEKKKKKEGADVVDSERERLFEDAFDHYGFKIDVGDRRMQLMLEDLEEQKALEAKMIRKAEKVKDAEKALQAMIAKAESIQRLNDEKN
ncbi:hypothetical protein ACOME3_004689 [Neoechinorhynchus agilis]